MPPVDQAPPGRGASWPVVVDLDGVVYRGRQPISGSPEALARLADAGIDIYFVTNNSTRTVEQAAEKIAAVTGFPARPAHIVTSANAAIALIPPGARRCLVLGGDGIVEAVGRAGLDVVEDDGDVDCVMVGLDRTFDYDRLDLASRAIRDGAVFIATNTDPTFPSPNGLMPGAGSIVAAIATASGTRPLVAGKPERPTVELIRSLGVDGPAWVIGDRIDTDIELAASTPGWRSILVLTGVTGADDDHSRADHVVADLAAAADLVLGSLDER